jgi:Uma2 family endonuclease
VVCGKLETDPADAHGATKPAVIVEIMSPSTEKHDREVKYRRSASLRAYVLVSQDERLVEVFTRNADDSWTLRDYRAGKARLDDIECTLDLDALYANPLATGSAGTAGY